MFALALVPTLPNVHQFSHVQCLSLHLHACECTHEKICPQSDWWVREESLELQASAKKAIQTGERKQRRWLSGTGRASGGPQRQNFRLRRSPWGSCASWEKDGPLNTFEQKKCMLVFHWGKTLAQRDSLGRLPVRQSQGIASCWHGYGQERASCCDIASLMEPNLNTVKGDV